jgi:hypothetical protein
METVEVGVELGIKGWRSGIEKSNIGKKRKCLFLQKTFDLLRNG